MLINGDLIQTASNIDVLNPATEKLLARAPKAERQHLDHAVRAARRAFSSWSKRPIDDRRVALRKLADLIGNNVDELKCILTAEQGKPLADSEGELLATKDSIHAIASLELPIIVSEDTEAGRTETKFVPIGVVAAIAPWNLPVLLAFIKIANALLAGNTAVLKPSPFTPLTTLRIAELVRDLFPPGVLNVLSGDDDLGPWITAHPEIDKISFTGSSVTGKKVMASAADHLKRITLELGGNDAAIVLPDVNIASVARDVFWTCFRNAGQVCINTKRLYVHDSIYDDFARELVAYAKTVKVGNGAERDTIVGPIQNQVQYRRVLSVLKDAHDAGLRFLLGGEATPCPGYFVPITIIDNPPENSRVVTEEVFGPVLPILRFSQIDDVVKRANNSPYGLAGSIWSADVDRAREIAERLETGMVWINRLNYMTARDIFGGHKQSGLGVEGGVHGLLSYTNPKTLVTARA
jgi:acyl-CoA reductase-like NAD-dependent aldehyde dehydrogenase